LLIQLASLYITDPNTTRALESAALIPAYAAFRSATYWVGVPPKKSELFGSFQTSYARIRPR